MAFHDLQETFGILRIFLCSVSVHPIRFEGRDHGDHRHASSGSLRPIHTTTHGDTDMKTTTTYTEACSDAVENHSNDFNWGFSWSVYALDEPSWLYNDNPVGVAIDGTREPIRYFAIWDTVADTGFLDWCISWHCDEVSRQPIDEEEWDRFGPKSKSLDMVPSDPLNAYTSDIADRINVEAVQGYHEDPTHHLIHGILDYEDCHWLGDAAYVREPESGHVFRIMPQFCAGDGSRDVINIPNDGHGWLSDCTIDSIAWVEAILNSGNGREITHEMVEWMDDENNIPEREGSARVAEAFTAIIPTVE